MNMELTCDMCNNKFYLPKSEYKKKFTRCYKHRFCSNKCKYLFSRNPRKQKINLNCTNCNTSITKSPWEMKSNKSGNFFCSQSCAATYNNTHKTTGNRRSKLEIYLEEQIELNYPELKCQYNNKETINSELDFYFPTLKLAIELNGILHYEPIYGQNKLERVQNNDLQKTKLCLEKGIELCIIDASQYSHLTQKTKDKYWKIVNELIQSLYKRHSQPLCLS